MLWSYDFSEPATVLWPALEGKPSLYLERKQASDNVKNITVGIHTSAVG